MAHKNVFITGGAGFIGRWLVKQCLEENLNVTVYDNLFAGRLDNIESFRNQVDFVKADILDYQRVRAAMEEHAADTVFHLAAHHFIPFCNQYPLETMRVNVEGTYSVLKAAAETGVKVVVMASSGGVYPDQDAPLKESETPQATDVYSLSKILCEEICQLFGTSTPLKCRVARIFNVYGPNETNSHLIPHIIQSLRRGPCVELGSTHTKRDYVYVEDVARSLLRYSEINGEKYTVVNIGTGHEYSANEIVAEMSDLIGIPLEIRTAPERIRGVDRLHQRADITYLLQLTGYSPRYSLRDGLKTLLNHEGL